MPDIPGHTCAFDDGFNRGFSICPDVVGRRGTGAMIPLPPRQKLRRLAKIRIGGSALQFTITTGKLRLQRRVAGKLVQLPETTGRLKSYQRFGGAVLQESLTPGLARVELVISGDVEAIPSLAEGWVGVHPSQVEDHVEVRAPQTIAISGLPVLGGSVAVGAVRCALTVSGAASGVASVSTGAIGHARAVAGSARGAASVAVGVVRCALVVFGEAFAQPSEGVGAVGVACAVRGEVIARAGIAIGRIETDDEGASLMILGLPSDVLV